MKKMLVLALSSVAVVGLGVRPAAAFWPFSDPAKCDCKAKAVITCNQYNAFSPFCCDTKGFQGGCNWSHKCAELQNCGSCYIPGVPADCCGNVSGCETTTQPAAPADVKPAPAMPTIPAPAPKLQAAAPAPNPQPVPQAFSNAFSLQANPQGTFPGYSPLFAPGFAPQTIPGNIPWGTGPISQ